mgnify:CR=1 FL=1
MSNGSGVLRLNRFSYQNAHMGFDPASLGMITLAATSAAAGAASASAQKKSAEATRRAADANAATLRNEADLQKQTGMENAKRMQQDAARQMGEARLDAAQSSLLREGSVPIREQALATRLQTRIQDEAAEAMRNAQSLYNRANTEQYMGRSNARAQKTSAMGTLLSFLTPPCRAAPEEQPPKTALPDTSLPVFLTSRVIRPAHFRLPAPPGQAIPVSHQAPRHNLSVSDCCQ